MLYGISQKLDCSSTEWILPRKNIIHQDIDKRLLRLGFKILVADGQFIKVEPPKGWSAEEDNILRDRKVIIYDDKNIARIVCLEYSFATIPYFYED